MAIITEKTFSVRNLVKQWRFMVLCGMCAVLLVAIGGCRDDEDFLTETGAMVEFSVDTLRFDTVFTSRGSATRGIKVYNRNDQPVRLSSVVIEGDPGFFRMNVDGIAANVVNEVDIAAGDSLYIFVEVTIDPDQPLSVSPFVVEDRILIELNGLQQVIVLEAWGQNANYLPFLNGKGQDYSLCGNGDFVLGDDPRPYVIFGRLVIDDCTCTVREGTRLYMHGALIKDTVVTQNPDQMVFDTSIAYYNDGAIFVVGKGRLMMEGTIQDPIRIQGDRLEAGFANIPGQWFGIALIGGTKGNELSNVEIKNSAFGVFVDSAAQVSMSQVRISNISGSGILGRHASIDAKNCLVSNTGGQSVLLTYGGEYLFEYCTLASYGNSAATLVMDNVRCEDILCSQFRLNPLTARFRNCIVAGSQRDEIQLVNFSEFPEDLDYRFEHCVVRVDELPEQDAYTNFFDYCTPCLNISASDPLFLDGSAGDWSLDSLSVADGYATPIPGVSFDLIGTPRDPLSPDAGALELQL